MSFTFYTLWSLKFSFCFIFYFFIFIFYPQVFEILVCTLMKFSQMPSKFEILHSAIELLKFRCMPSNCRNFSFWPPGLEIRCHLPLSFWNFVEWPWLFFSLFPFPSSFLSVSVIFCPPSAAASSAFSDVQHLSPFLCGVVSLLRPLELYFSSLPHTSSCSNSSLWSTRATMILAIGHLLLAASGLGRSCRSHGRAPCRSLSTG